MENISNSAKILFRLVKHPIINPLKKKTLKFLDYYHINQLSRLNHLYAKRFSKVLNQFLRFDLLDEPEIIRLIECEREKMLSCEDDLVDGSLGKYEHEDESLTVGKICQSSKDKNSAILLYLLICEFKPLNAIELGTCLGISCAYQAAALKSNSSNGKIITFEYSPYRLRIAEDLHKKLNLTNITYQEGFFRSTLEQTLNSMKNPVDFAFIDGHHQYKPTLDYFNLISNFSSENAIFIFDDIRWSDGMNQVWNEIISDKKISLTIDLHSMGICVLSRNNSPKCNVIGPMRCIL